MHVNLNAQNPLIKHFTQKDGLPSNVVYDVCQDLEGFIWIATDKGLVRYDGVQFKRYGLAEGLPTNDIFRIQIDDEGTLWFDIGERRQLVDHFRITLENRSPPLKFVKEKVKLCRF